MRGPAAVFERDTSQTDATTPGVRESLWLALVVCACGGPSSPAADGGADGWSEAGAEDGHPGDSATDAAPAACAIDAAPGHHGGSCLGLAYDLEVPTSCPVEGCGLVLEVHGLWMNADAMDANTHMRALGRARGYAVLQPTAPSGRTVQGPAWLDADDDAVWTITTAVAAALHTDPKRLHVTGFSQGGYMAWRMICKHSSSIASAAPGAAGAAGCPINNLNGSCNFAALTPAPIDVLFVAGRLDAIVPIGCARAQVQSAITGWSLGPKQVVATDGVYERARYAGNSNVLEVIEHDYTTNPAGLLAANAGHCVPGATPASGTIWDQLACKGPNAFVWGDEVMAFFQAHPKP